MFINPLAKKNNAKADESDWSDVDAEDEKRKKGEDADKKKEKGLTGKRKRKGSLDNVGDFFGKEGIEEVPANDPATR